MKWKALLQVVIMKMNDETNEGVDCRLSLLLFLFLVKNEKSSEA